MRLKVRLVNKGHNRRFALDKKLLKTKDPSKTLIFFKIENKLFLKFPVFSKYKKMYIGVPYQFANANKLKIDLLGIFSEKELFRRDIGVIKIIRRKAYITLNAILAKEIKIKTYRKEQSLLKLYTIKLNNQLYIFPRLFVMQQPIVINQYISADDFAAILGFYFCEGSKTEIFQIVNSEKEVMDRFLGVLYKILNISKFNPYCVVGYVTTGRFDKTEKELKYYWENALKKYKLKVNKVVLHKTKAKINFNKRVEYGSFSFRIGCPLPLYLLLGILNSGKIDELLKDRQLSYEILRWIAAGDMYPNKDAKSFRVAIAAQDSELEFYEKLLKACNLKISFIQKLKGGRGITNEIVISTIKDIIKILKLDIFRYINYRKAKLLKSFVKVPSIKRFLEYKNYLNEGIDIASFAKLNNIKVGLATQPINTMN